MRKYKFLVFAPYPGLAEVAKKVKEEFDDFELEVVIANLRAKERIKKRMEQDDFDVVITRGGVSEFVRTLTHKPAIEIEITPFDMIRVMKLIEGYEGKVVIAAYSNIAKNIKTIKELLNNDIDIYKMHRYDYDMTEKSIDEMMEKKYSVIIGDTGTWEYAKSRGITSVLITSGTEAVYEAYKRALDICGYIAKESEKNTLLCEFIEGSEDMIEIKDGGNNVLYSSFPRDKYFDSIKEEAYKKYQDEGFSENEVYAVIKDGKCWCADMVRNGNNAAILRIKRNYLEEKGFKDTITIWHGEPTGNFENILMQSNSESSKKIAEQINYYSRLDMPIMLIGEKGVGKKELAREIHKRSNFSQFVFVEIHCSEIEDKEIDKLFGRLNGEISNVRYATLFFKDINCLSLPSQKTVYDFLHQPKNKKNYKVIASAYQKLETAVAEKRFSERLYQITGELSIYVPSLRERMEDIQSLIGIFISEFNISYGKQMISIESGGIEEIKNYNWPGNFYQFKRVMLQLLLMSENSFVPHKLVKDMIEQEKKEVGNFSGISVERDETLEDLERKIILKVLEEEDMNQSKAANRLGISRSTLWRKIK